MRRVSRLRRPVVRFWVAGLHCNRFLAVQDGGAEISQFDVDKCPVREQRAEERLQLAHVGVDLLRRFDLSLDCQAGLHDAVCVGLLAERKTKTAELITDTMQGKGIDSRAAAQ